MNLPPQRCEGSLYSVPNKLLLRTQPKSVAGDLVVVLSLALLVVLLPHGEGAHPSPIRLLLNGLTGHGGELPRRGE